MARLHGWAGLVALALGLLASAASARAESPALKNPATGNPTVKGIDVITFGPGGLLLIGDGKGSQLVAVDTGDTAKKSPFKGVIEQIDEKLAGRLGTTAKGIEIKHLAVNPASGVAYVAIRKQDDKRDVILTVDGAGQINDYVLENVKYVTVKLPAGESAPVDRVSDIAVAGDQILVSGRANENFGSKLFTIRTPLSPTSTVSNASTETYHVAHGRWETKAPMETILPYEEDGKRYIVGAFTCTPLVKYPIDDIKPGAKVKGTSMVELGQGNMPQDMLVYEKNGHNYVLVNTVRRFKPYFGPSPYWTARVDLELMRGTEKTNEQAVRRVDRQNKPIVTDRIQMVESYFGVRRMDRLDADNALVLKEDGQGHLDLMPLPLP